jgi:hypothetical protein
MKSALEKLVEIWTSDVSFRAEFRRNPQAAAKSRGIELDAETLAVARSIQAMGAAELETRINMDGPNNGC